MTPVHHVDSMGLHFLEDLVFTTRAKGIELFLANPNHKVRANMEEMFKCLRLNIV